MGYGLVVVLHTGWWTACAIYRRDHPPLPPLPLVLLLRTVSYHHHQVLLLLHPTAMDDLQSRPITGSQCRPRPLGQRGNVGAGTNQESDHCIVLLYYTTEFTENTTYYYGVITASTKINPLRIIMIITAHWVHVPAYALDAAWRLSSCWGERDY